MPSENDPAARAADAVDSADAVAPVDADGSAEREASGAVDGHAPDRDPIEWGPVRHERLRSLAVGVTVAVVGAVLIGITAIVAALLTGAAGDGVDLSNVGVGDVVVGVGLLFAVGVATVPTLYVWYRESPVDELAGSRLREAAGRLSAGWTLAGFGAVVGLLLAVPGDVLPAFWPLFTVVWFLPAVIQSSGVLVRVDPTAATVDRTYPAHDRTRSDDLGSVVRTRRIDLPWTTLFLLAYRGNAWYRSTPWLFVPSDRADRVESALDAVLAASDGPSRASVPERITLAVLGSSSLVVGLLMAVAAGEGAGGVALALLTAPFSILFLALAARL